ncbi:MAG: STAS domain-containing protein [Phycisphaerales bacterium]|nr:STAS domain-containing protein [Phycisphaerales bacterium]
MTRRPSPAIVRQMPHDIPNTRLAGSLEQVLVVEAPEALDHTAAGPMRQAVEQDLADRDDAAVVLDLSQVELITSIGIAALLEIREFCADRDAPLVLAGLGDEPRSMLALLRLEGKFQYAASVDEAVGDLGG